MTMIGKRWRAGVLVLAGAGLFTTGCTPVTDVPFVLEDLSGTYLPAGVYGTLEAVESVSLCAGTECVTQVGVGSFTQADASGSRECVLLIGGISLNLRSNGTFQLDGTRRQDCTLTDGTTEVTREALTAVGLYRMHGGRAETFTVIQSLGASGSYLLDGRLEGVASVTGDGQLVPRLVHFEVKDRSQLEFTMTWSQ